METYVYADIVRSDILRMIPTDGRIVGSIGCGRAATEAILERSGREVHGVDVSGEAIETARNRISSARVIRSNDFRPFPEKSLDGLILADVLEHVPSAWDALKGYVSGVKKGGWVVISVPNMRNLKILNSFVIAGDWPEDDVGIFDNTHVQVMTRKRLTRWCMNSGISVERWFPRYLSEGTKKESVLRAFDTLTLKMFHDWLLAELQARYRVL